MGRANSSGTVRGRDVDLTERQSQVLRLITAGKTNAEIGEALGISLDGAKWHVSEILSKLDVSTREAAAEYWRARNGLRGRFTRALRALIPSFGLLKVAGPVVVVAGVATAVGIAVFALRELGTGDDDGLLAAVGQTSATATTASSTTVPPSGSQTPAPQGAPLATLNGMPIYELKIGSPVGLPSDALLYFSETCSVCPGGQLFRATLASNGTWTREELVVKPPTGVPDGTPFGEFITDGKSRIAVLWCEGLCGKRHDGTADTTPRDVLLSEDRGVSWRKIGSTTTFWVLLGYQADEVLAWTPEGQYMLYPSGQSVPVPAPGGYQGSGMPQGVNILSTTDSQLHLQLGNDSSSMVATFPTGGGPSAYHAFPEGRLQVTAALSASELMGVAERTHSDRALLDRLPVYVDLTTGTIAPISGLTPSAQYAYLNPLLLVRGRFARVHSGSDCLNVRDSASKSATALGCFADGVLLRLRSQPDQTADGTTWLAVETPDGRAGWASAEFMER